MSFKRPRAEARSTRRGMEASISVAAQTPTLSHANPSPQLRLPFSCNSTLPRRTSLSTCNFFHQIPDVVLKPSIVSSGSLIHARPLSSNFWLKATVANVTSASTHWMVVLDKPPTSGSSKAEIVDYYVQTLTRVMGNEIEAQMCIYNVSWQTHFGFCCDIDEETAKQLAGLPGVLSVRPDPEFESVEKDYSVANILLGHLSKSKGSASGVPSLENMKYWVVQMEKPSVEVVSKAQMVDYYVQTLTKVFGNPKDAQVSIYHISWQGSYGFCCVIDEECAQELEVVPGVLSVQPDQNFESDVKNYGGSIVSSDKNQTANIKTKRLFVTGLSFYTSEKTLRAAFEGFGELVEVKIIMDKISKRSKGYAFLEYTTEAAASAALKEMNGKIINGWMIVVDVAKTNPPKVSRSRSRPTL
ncbi:organelle RRM domain-containing protein 1, chloroplastic [Aristolochia californica]|uniref:organelle RRM domain-containing protein 1, chloroplastic n=1 Tax=Aristolochia californica TaxID=171875 RepID=UPI0035DD2370